jgi:hypothetical protein
VEKKSRYDRTAISAPARKQAVGCSRDIFFRACKDYNNEYAKVNVKRNKNSIDAKTMRPYMYACIWVIVQMTIVESRRLIYPKVSQKNQGYQR